MPLSKIISGGQTGADRAGLDAALELGFHCGGWCPEGRLAEDGPLPSIYPLDELPQAGYRQRTIKNIECSDGTVIFYFGSPEGGTELTLAQCIRLHKSYQLIDGRIIDSQQASQILASFLRQKKITVLNVAGPSESRNPGTYQYVRKTMLLLIQASQRDD